KLSEFFVFFSLHVVKPELDSGGGSWPLAMGWRRRRSPNWRESRMDTTRSLIASSILQWSKRPARRFRETNLWSADWSVSISSWPLFRWERRKWNRKVTNTDTSVFYIIFLCHDVFRAW